MEINNFKIFLFFWLKFELLKSWVEQYLWSIGSRRRLYAIYWRLRFDITIFSLFWTGLNQTLELSEMTRQQLEEEITALHREKGEVTEQLNNVCWENLSLLMMYIYIYFVGEVHGYMCTYMRTELATWFRLKIQEV
jgi:hypothetical protein